MVTLHTSRSAQHPRTRVMLQLWKCVESVPIVWQHGAMQAKSHPSVLRFVYRQPLLPERTALCPPKKKKVEKYSTPEDIEPVAVLLIPDNADSTLEDCKLNCNKLLLIQRLVTVSLTTLQGWNCLETWARA
jgi:hypothetical protein